MTMIEDTEEWLAEIKADLPAEAKPLAASLKMLASSMDAEHAENGRVSGALASGYRQTHRAVLDALRASQGGSDPDDDLFGAPA